MKVTRVIFNNPTKKDKALAVCSVVLDDSLRLNKIKLYRGAKGYFLTLPSLQEVAQEFDINCQEEDSKEKKYDEFFYPVDSSLYKQILDSIIHSYTRSKESGRKSINI